MEICYYFLNIHLLLCISSITPLTAKLINSKTDVSALLSFKSQISSDPSGVLSSWNESLHHCQWQGVRCGRRHPDRVTALVLDSKQLTGYICPSLGNLTFLQTISLSDNLFRGYIPIELGTLSRLRFVKLSTNFLEGSIPSTLGNCSNLQVIELFFNNLHGTIPSNIVQCKKLEKIDIGNNFLTGGIPPEFGHFPQLNFLGLDVNSLTGYIPSALGNLSSLIYLLLDKNDFDGQIPYNLGNLTNLLHLYLSKNSFIGHIPPTLGNLNNIEVLDIGQNMLSGFIPAAIGKLQKLQFFNIFSNNISGEIPHSLYNISAMVSLELGTNQLQGTLPFDMCNSFSNLKYLLVYENQLKGYVPASISNCSALTHLQMGHNYLSGTIPYNIGFLQKLQSFTIDFNKIEAKGPQGWKFLDALSNCTSLRYLYLAHNQLKGVLPSSIANLSTSLVLLALDGNPISGNIPADLGKLTNLSTLFLNDMLLNGTIPDEIGNLYRLELLDLSNNMISGQVPPTFTNLTQMEKLSLNNNELEYSIPPELSNMRSLQSLNLSNNKFRGKIPKEIMDLPLSISLDLSHNNLTDLLPPEIGKLKNIQSIRLSNNKLVGALPSTIDGCQVLQYLYLDSNLFQGVIPSSLGNLRGLQELNISNNSFSGPIPEFIGKMNLIFLDISFNNFEGELPKEGIFKNVSGIDVRGNPKLCGGPPELHLKQCISEFPAKRHHSHGKLVIIISTVASSIFLTLGLCLIATCYYRRRSEDNDQTDRALKFNLRVVSYHDILRATQNFSSENLIGRGAFGEVYKAYMSIENLTTVAVKVLNIEKHGALKSFLSECEVLRNVRHRNLIKVLTSCSSIDRHGNDFKALVFEFMQNGSLAEWLHPNANTYKNSPIRNLSLVQRLSIAVDVATGLDYLHYHRPTPIVHCDLKPSNVLLGDDMTAHVGDFGLARFLAPPNIPSQSLMTTGGIKGSIGYIPPEYGMGVRPSVEGDVYSYGILLLEMFTGVSPTDGRLRDGVSLYKYVEMAFPEQVKDIIDSKLFSAVDVEANTYASEKNFDCLVSVIQCGLFCSKESPKERISMKDAVRQLNSAWSKLLPS